MDGLRVLERAAVAPSDLRLDPAAPFRVTTAPGLSLARQAQVKAALLRAGWGQCDEAARAPVAAVLMTTPGAPDWLPFAHAMTDAQWDAFLDAMCARRQSLGMTWEQAPWKAWAQVLEAEASRREQFTPTWADVDAEHGRLAGHCAVVLRMLKEAGPTGVTMQEFQRALGAGAHHPGRIYDLRQGTYPALGAWEIKTVKLSMRDHKWVLVREAPMKQATLEAVA